MTAPSAATSRCVTGYSAAVWMDDAGCHPGNYGNPCRESRNLLVCNFSANGAGVWVGTAQLAVREVDFPNESFGAILGVVRKENHETLKTCNAGTMDTWTSALSITALPRGPTLGPATPC